MCWKPLIIQVQEEPFLSSTFGSLFELFPVSEMFLLLKLFFQGSVHKYHPARNNFSHLLVLCGMMENTGLRGKRQNCKEPGLKSPMISDSSATHILCDCSNV